MSSGERVDGHNNGNELVGGARLGHGGSSRSGRVREQKRGGGGKGAHLAARMVALGGLVAAETAPETKKGGDDRRRGRKGSGASVLPNSS